MPDQLSPMSFREKSAWISLVSLVVVFGAYFSYIGLVLAGLARNRFALFLVMVAVFILAEVVLHLVIATESPRDARTPKDEREQLIERQPHPTDLRLSFVKLSDKGAERTELYLTETLASEA